MPDGKHLTARPKWGILIREPLGGLAKKKITWGTFGAGGPLPGFFLSGSFPGGGKLFFGMHRVFSGV